MAYLTVWIVSGGLHGALLVAFSHPAVATAFILGFAGLGLVAALARAAVHHAWLMRRSPRVTLTAWCCGDSGAEHGR